ncbi:hypothetical protein [Amycolatopsis sp. 195334CR]|uniref:hypothetical protein n=1 Tax=Amycolatopsis sp. 195334CR TaxID=2814588 RepID=UPI001A8C9C55|nr:hypothetical protein [Amycolatopsis sp. 195334CR]MBN6039743.1 hypothetical protein [Amycolatopsis sp. 195334CR]
MGDNEPWLSRIADTVRRSGTGLITDEGRVSWAELVDRAWKIAADLRAYPHGLVVAPDGGPDSVVALLAAGLAEPAQPWVIGDPARWGTGEPIGGTALWAAGPQAAPPAEIDGATYATATESVTGQPQLLFGRPDSLHEAARLYAEGLPEFADAELFAACAPMDFAETFHLVVLPSIVLGRDLMLFQPRQWRAAGTAFDGRPVVCLTTTALALLGARAAPEDRDYTGVCFLPSGGGLTPERAERVAARFAGCSFLNVLGSPETGLLAVTREVAEDGHVGKPLAGKQIWLRDVGEDGVGTLWTAGPDARIAASDGFLRRTPDGAVSKGHLAHAVPGGGFVLDGQAGDLVELDGRSVDPAEVVAAVRGLRGVVDASLTVDRSGPAERVTVVATGDVTEEQVRRRLGALAVALVPHEVVCHIPTA